MGGVLRAVTGAEEKSRGRHRPAADGRSVAAADRPDQCSRTQPGHDWRLKHFRSAPKVFGDKLGALPQTPVRGEQEKLAPGATRRRGGGPSYPATKDLTLSTL